MPLIIVVLIIIVVFINTKDKTNNNEIKRREYTASIRKTNAKLELELVQQFYRLDQNEDRSIELAKAELINRGFEPCIPRNAYVISSFGNCVYVYGRGYDCRNFDSRAVRSLREDFSIMSNKLRTQFASQEEFEQKQEEYVYNNLPKTISEYKRYLTLSIARLDAIGVGSLLSYPGLGTCEVVALDYKIRQHTVKVLSTGEIKKIPFSDKRIIRL